MQGRKRKAAAMTLLALAQEDVPFQCVPLAPIPFALRTPTTDCSAAHSHVLLVPHALPCALPYTTSPASPSPARVVTARSLLSILRSRLLAASATTTLPSCRPSEGARQQQRWRQRRAVGTTCATQAVMHLHLLGLQLDAMPRVPHTYHAPCRRSAAMAIPFTCTTAASADQHPIVLLVLFLLPTHRSQRGVIQVSAPPHAFTHHEVDGHSAGVAEARVRPHAVLEAGAVGRARRGAFGIGGEGGDASSLSAANPCVPYGGVPHDNKHTSVQRSGITPRPQSC